MALLYPFTMELSFTTEPTLNDQEQHKNTTTFNTTTTTLHSQSMNTISSCKSTEPTLNDQQHKNTTTTTTNTTLPSQSMSTISSCKSTQPSTCAPSMENGIDDQAKPVLGAERMKKHWKEVSVRGVVIPETWGKEDFLKDWTQSTIFDALIARKRVDAARQALIAEKQKTAAASVRELQV